MNIQIQEKRKTILNLWLPNLLLTSKFATKMFLKATRPSKENIQMAQANPEIIDPSLKEQIKQQSKADVKALKDTANFSQEEIQNARACMATLKKYIKKHGHFTLVEVHSADTYVRIRV